MEQDERLTKLNAILDRVYTLEGHVPCGAEPHRCRTGCEPGLSETTIVLLPGEVEYISKRLGEPAKFETTDLPDGRKVGFQKSRCPYLDDQSMCTIYEHRPVDCRSYPFVPTMIENEEEGVRAGMKSIMDSKCPLDKKMAVMRRHKITWLAVWKELSTVLDATWWELYDSTDPIPEVLDLLKRLNAEEEDNKKREALFTPQVATATTG